MKKVRKFLLTANKGLLVVLYTVGPFIMFGLTLVIFVVLCMLLGIDTKGPWVAIYIPCILISLFAGVFIMLLLAWYIAVVDEFGLYASGHWSKVIFHMSLIVEIMFYAVMIYFFISFLPLQVKMKNNPNFHPVLVSELRRYFILGSAIVALLCYSYTIYFVGYTIAKYVEGRDSIGRYVVNFLMLFLLPVGIWVLQPSITQKFNSEKKDNFNIPEGYL